MASGLADRAVPGRVRHPITTHPWRLENSRRPTSCRASGEQHRFRRFPSFRPGRSANGQPEVGSRIFSETFRSVMKATTFIPSPHRAHTRTSNRNTRLSNAAQSKRDGRFDVDETWFGPCLLSPKSRSTAEAAELGSEA
jgi:hypothetical protein